MYIANEIITEIGSYLTTKEKSTCLRVCYNWYEPFLRLLYKSIYISSRKQFKLFMETIESSSRLLTPLGEFVVEIVFRSDEKVTIGLTSHELENIAVYFKNLKALEFNSKLWKYLKYPRKFLEMEHIIKIPEINKKSVLESLIKDVIKDNLLSQLTYLSISGEATEYLMGHQLTGIWTKINRLETLKIKGTKSFTEINVKLLMTLGGQLTALKNFELNSISLSLNENDMNSTTTFPLFSSAVSLILKDVHIKNWRMITFLSLAFYHVEILDFDITLDWLYDENVTIELYEKSMDAFMGFAQLCIFLKKVIFRKIKSSVFPFPYDAFFLEIADIHKKHVDIEMIEYAWWSTIDPSPSFKAATTQTGLLSKVDLKWSWTGKKSDLGIIKNLKCCPNLTELELDCDIITNKYGIRIDLLIENCKQLQVIKLCNSLVSTSANYNCNNTIYRNNNLHSLSLSNAVLGDHLMEFLSLNCLKLENLNLDNCVQEKPRRSTFIVMRMPEHNFKSIKLNNIHLNPGGNLGKSEQNITILSFYESNRYTHQIERLKATNQSVPEMWRFYHIYSNRRLRRLSTEEAAMVANFEMTDKKWKYVRQATKRKAYLDKSLWEKDIQFGSILLLCKSVKYLEFNEIKV